jgi:hypothetical protein
MHHLLRLIVLPLLFFLPGIYTVKIRNKVYFNVWNSLQPSQNYYPSNGSHYTNNLYSKYSFIKAQLSSKFYSNNPFLNSGNVFQEQNFRLKDNPTTIHAKRLWRINKMYIRPKKVILNLCNYILKRSRLARFALSNSEENHIKITTKQFITNALQEAISKKIKNKEFALPNLNKQKLIKNTNEQKIFY